MRLVLCFPKKKGDGELPGEAPVVEELKYLGSMLSKNFDDRVTIMARIRLARIALTKLQKAIFGTRRVALESKKIAVLSPSSELGVGWNLVYCFVSR